jgi:molecular chaperone GrpE
MMDPNKSNPASKDNAAGKEPEVTGGAERAPRMPQYQKPQASDEPKPDASSTEPGKKPQPDSASTKGLQLDNDSIDDPFMQNMLLSAEDLETGGAVPPIEFDENPKVAVLQVRLAEKEKDFRQLERVLKQKDGEIAQAKDQALRGLAEAENARKRALKEREDAMKYGIAGFAKEMLDLADNLRRAIESFPQDFVNVDPRLKSFFEGIEATERALLRSLEMQGIKKIEPMDELFNPNFHEVMFEAPGTGKPAGTVVQIIEPGFILKDRLLRPARVGIAKDESQGSDPSKSPMTPGGQIDTQA